MRTLILILLAFKSIFSFGQSAFEKQYSSDVCNCMESKQNTSFNTDNFLICFQQVLGNDSAQIIQEYKKIYGDTIFSESRHFGNDLYNKLKISMVSECKPYATFLDSLRYNEVKSLNKDSVRLELKNLNTTAFLKQDISFYNQKSVLFFQLQLYDSAINNSNKVLKQDSNNAQAMYFKGWANEIKGNYDVPVMLYNKLALLTRQDYFLILSALVKRKKNGM